MSEHLVVMKAELRGLEGAVEVQLRLYMPAPPFPGMMIGWQDDQTEYEVVSVKWVVEANLGPIHGSGHFECVVRCPVLTCESSKSIQEVLEPWERRGWKYRSLSSSPVQEDE